MNHENREEMAERFKRESGKSVHSNTCATSVAPAEIPSPCDCDNESTKPASPEVTFVLGCWVGIVVGMECVLLVDHESLRPAIGLLAAGVILPLIGGVLKQVFDRRSTKEPS